MIEQYHAHGSDSGVHKIQSCHTNSHDTDVYMDESRHEFMSIMIEWRCTYNWVMSHVRRSHVAHIAAMQMSIQVGHITDSCPTWLCDIIHTNDSCLTYKWVMSHVQMSDVSHMNAQRVLQVNAAWVCMRMSHSILTHTISHTHKWVVSHVRISHLSHKNACRVLHTNAALFCIQMIHISHTWQRHAHALSRTQSCTWHNSFICVTWLNPMCDMTHWCRCPYHSRREEKIWIKIVTAVRIAKGFGPNHESSHWVGPRNYIENPDSGNYIIQSSSELLGKWHVAATWIPRCKYEWVMPHIWMSHVTHDWVASHIEKRYTCSSQWVVSHIWQRPNWCTWMNRVI